MNVRLVRSVCIKRNRTKEGRLSISRRCLRIPSTARLSSGNFSWRFLCISCLKLRRRRPVTLSREMIYGREGHFKTWIFDPITPMAPLPLFTNTSDFSWTQWWTLCGIGWARKYPVAARVHYSGSRAGEPSHLVDEVFQVMNVNATDCRLGLVQCEYNVLFYYYQYTEHT
jgi:hypothetical protein